MKADDLKSLERTEQMMDVWGVLVLLMWWGVEDWDGLDIWNVKVYMIAEGWW